MQVPATIEEAAHELALVKQAAESVWDTVKGYGQKALDGVNSLMPKSENSAIGESMSKNPLLQRAWNFAGPEAVAGLAGAGVGGVLGAVTSDKKKRRRNAVTGALAGAGLGAGGMLAARTMGFDPSSLLATAPKPGAGGKGGGPAAAGGGAASAPEKSLPEWLREEFTNATKPTDPKAEELLAAYNEAKNNTTPGVGGALKGVGAAAGVDAALTGASWLERRRKPTTPTMDAHAFQHGASVADETGLKNLGAGVSPEDTQAIYKQMSNMNATTPGAADALLAKARQGQGHDFRLSPDVSHRFTPEQMAALRGDPAEALYNSLHSPDLRHPTRGISSSALDDTLVNTLRNGLGPEGKGVGPEFAAKIHESLATRQPLRLTDLVDLPPGYSGPVEIPVNILESLVTKGQTRTYLDRLKSLPLAEWATGGEDAVKQLRSGLSGMSESDLASFLKNNTPEIKVPGRTVHVPPARIRAIQDLGVQPGTWAGASPAADFMQNLTAPSSAFKPRSTWGSGLRRAGGYTAAGIGGLALEYLLRQRHAAAAKQQYEDYIKNLTR